MRPQTVKQTAWVEAMLTGVTPTEAARIAKYAPNTWMQRGYENVRKSYLMEVIAEKRAIISDKVENKVEDILQGVMALAYPVDGVLVNNGDKLRALELLGKERAMWKDNQVGQGEKTIIIISPKPPKVIDSQEIEDEVPE